MAQTIKNVRAIYGNWSKITHSKIEHSYIPHTAKQKFSTMPRLFEWIWVITVPIKDTVIAIMDSDSNGKLGDLLWEANE